MQTLIPLQRVTRDTVRLIGHLGCRYLVTASMQALQWLPITNCIKYKMCIMVFEASNGPNPTYITEIRVPTSSLPIRVGLRSSMSGTVDIRRIRTQYGHNLYASRQFTCYKIGLLPSFVVRCIVTFTTIFL